MGKTLSLLLLLQSLFVFQSCISTDGTLGEKNDFEYESLGVKEHTEETELIVDDDDGIVMSIEEKNALLEDTISEELAATKKILASKTTGELLNYQTKKYDTLMLIAFRIYGDYRMWRDLYSLNKEVITKGNGHYDLSHRPLLKYRKPLRPYTPPIGNPYLIKSGDSLSLISKKVYGNWREWPVIHKSNPHQIRDPNLIFTGFTLYYPSLKKLARQLY